MQTTSPAARVRRRVWREREGVREVDYVRQRDPNMSTDVSLNWCYCEWGVICVITADSGFPTVSEAVPWPDTSAQPTGLPRVVALSFLPSLHLRGHLHCVFRANLRIQQQSLSSQLPSVRSPCERAL